MKFLDRKKTVKLKEIPCVLTHCIREIESRFIAEEGLYRRTGVKSKINNLLQKFKDDHHKVDLEECDVKILSSAVKQYLNELPDSLLTFKLYNSFIKLAKDEQSAKLQGDDLLKKMKSLLDMLPEHNLATLQLLVRHMVKICQYRESNEMNVSNTAMCLCQSIVRPKTSDVKLETEHHVHRARVIQLMLLNPKTLFGIDEDVNQLKSIEAPPEEEEDEESLLDCSHIIEDFDDACYDFGGGALVWMPCPVEGYIQGQIVVNVPPHAEVSPLDDPQTKKSFPLRELFVASETEETKDDCCSLMEVNPASLLNNVRSRFAENKIYTYVANIVIAVNPFRDIPGLYEKETIAMYRNRSLGTMPPHIYAIADKTYNDMVADPAAQHHSIIVSGESGAGKSETTKYLLKYLTSNFATDDTIVHRIVESNPLLEAFGNAKTVRNTNSSRFGKFVEIHFNEEKRVCGGFISHYLLEKTRVCSQNSKERNYHIFNLMCGGAPAALKQTLETNSLQQFKYVSGGDIASLEAIQMQAQFNEVDHALNTMGIDQAEKEQVYGATAGVLHLGNVLFKDQAGTIAGCAIDPACVKEVAVTAKLLGLNEEELTKALTTKMMKTGSDTIRIQLKGSEAEFGRDALAKTVYSKLFDYIVKLVNSALPFSASKSYIGILDIAGFEYFEENSLEQFCINYVNEKLQQFFNMRILKGELQLYHEEKLDVKDIVFADNKDCLELLEGKIGIFSLLDEEIKLPKPTAKHFSEEVFNQNKKNPRLDEPRKSRLDMHKKIRQDEGFLVRHYAGFVVYHTHQFVEKNQDTLHKSLKELLLKSTNPVMKKIFEGETSEDPMKDSKAKRKIVTVGSVFRDQLKMLMDKLGSGPANFIRCIKPNSKSVPMEFDGASVLSQLRCSGVTAVLELMQQGFPSRVVFSDLYNMYRDTMPAHLKKLDSMSFCQALFKVLNLDEEDFKFGQTRVFFRPGKFAEFDELLKSDAASMKQKMKMLTHWIARKNWRRLFNKALLGHRLWWILKYKKEQREAAMLGLVARYRFRQRAIVVLELTATLRAGQIRKLALLQDQLVKDKDIGIIILCHVMEMCDSFMSSMRDRGQNIITADARRAYEEIMMNLRLAEQALAALVEKQQKNKKVSQADLLKLMDTDKRKNVDWVKQLEDDIIKEEKRKARVLEKKRRDIQMTKDAEERARKLASEREIAKQREAQDKKKSEEVKKEQDAEDADVLKETQEHNEVNIDDVVAARLAEDVNVPFSRGGPQRKIVRPHKLDDKSMQDIMKTIINSSDAAMVSEYRLEIKRRVHFYHEWRSRCMGFDPDERIPQQLFQKVNYVAYPMEADKFDEQQRCFLLPFGDANPTKPRPRGGKHGMWYIHYDGNYVARQLEVYASSEEEAGADGSCTSIVALQPAFVPQQKSRLLVAGVDDMNMCEFTLREILPILLSTPNSEIDLVQFDLVWNENGGERYVLKRHRWILSKSLRKSSIKK